MNGAVDDATAVPRKSLRVHFTPAGLRVAYSESFLRKNPLLPWIAVIRVLVNLYASVHSSSIHVERKPAMNARKFE
jgi:hypothetical protein